LRRNHDRLRSDGTPLLLLPLREDPFLLASFPCCPTPRHTPPGLYIHASILPEAEEEARLGSLLEGRPQFGHDASASLRPLPLRKFSFSHPSFEYPALPGWSGTHSEIPPEFVERLRPLLHFLLFNWKRFSNPTPPPGCFPLHDCTEAFPLVIRFDAFPL